MHLNQRIRNFYDASTDLWLHAWGDHMHHGYYGPDGKATVNHQQAQVDMIEALLAWGGEPDTVQRIFDAGCGVGASSRYLVNRFPGAQALGFTLSPVQVGRGKALNKKANLDQQCEIRAADVYEISPSEGPFDLIWSMESAEHMADKQALFTLFHQLLSPGGRVLMATWCHREEPPTLSTAEHSKLQKICRHFHLPAWVSISTLKEAATQAGFKAVRSADWSDSVAPFWGAVIRESLQPKNWPGLLRSGPGTLQ
ncbi:MAG: methyltransferase domain-containing protein, partial [Bacteroidota bacterium]